MIKDLLGLSQTNITDIEIITKLRQAQKMNLGEVEFNIDGDIVKILLPKTGS